jgi:YNFM family putative membrane transporter
MYITQPLLPLLSGEYHVSAVTAALTVSAVVFAVALASSAYGPLADALGCKAVMTTGCAALALATLACAFAPNFAALVALRGVQGVLVPSVAALGVVYLGALSGDGDPGALVGAYIGATVLGGLSGRVGSGLIAQASSWRTPFFVFAAVTALAAIVLFVAVQDVRGPGRRSTLGAAYREMGAHFGNSRLLGAFIVAATLFFGFVGLFTYLPYLLSAPPFSLSTGTIAWFYASYLAGVVTAPLAGRLSSHVSRRVLIAAGFAVAIAGTTLTTLHALGAIVAGIVVLCVGMFVAQAVAPAYVNVTAKTAKAGANSLYQAFYYTGAVLGSTLPGLALERFGWDGVILTCDASLIVGLVAGVTLCTGDRPLPSVPQRSVRTPDALR